MPTIHCANCPAKKRVLRPPTSPGDYLIPPGWSWLPLLGYLCHSYLAKLHRQGKPVPLDRDLVGKPLIPIPTPGSETGAKIARQRPDGTTSAPSPAPVPRALKRTALLGDDEVVATVTAVAKRQRTMPGTSG